VSIVQISEKSWDGILKIQEEAYTDLPPEDVSILKSKWLASPDTCFIYSSNENKILAYLLSHPWGSDSPPKLNEEATVDKDTSNLYLHDLALSNEARGQGIARALVENLINNAKTQGFTKIQLVAVQGSSSFWVKYGFMVIVNAAICPSYGSAARLMVLELDT
jgi:ribosomal protein S18 acetylase RimI-like enzyme